MMYAGPRGTAKGTKDSLRIRIVMDVLDDVRSRHNIDPDRTYITGFYGGARIANKIDFLLPEYFGGAVLIADGISPPEPFWQVARLADRTSVVHLVGRQDQRGPGNQRLGLTRLWHSELSKTKIRTQFASYPGSVTLMPPSALLEKSIRWLEADLERRRTMGKRFPSTRIGAALSRKEQAETVLADAKRQLELPESTHQGLLMLEHVAERWPDLELANIAEGMMQEYVAREGPWQEELLRDKRILRNQRIQRLRPIRERDPPRDSVALPRKYSHPSRWVVDLDASRTNVASDGTRGKTSAMPEYDERTRFVIKRLGSRAHLDHSGRVDMLNLEGTRVTSKQLKHLKGQLHGMKEVRTFNLSHTEMSESTLRNIADLVELQFLNLSGSELSNRGMEHLAKMHQLRFLSIRKTDVTVAGFRRISSVRNLRCLNMGDTKVDEQIFAAIAAASNLEVLSLASTRVSDVSEILSFGSLKHLDLSNTKVDDSCIEFLSELNELESLLLNYTGLTDVGLAKIAGIGGLREIQLVGTKISDAGLQELAQLPFLVMLNVRSTRVTGEGVAKLSEQNAKVEIKWEGNRTLDVSDQIRLLEPEGRGEIDDRDSRRIVRPTNPYE